MSEISINLNYGLLFPDFNPFKTVRPRSAANPATKPQSVPASEQSSNYRSEEFDYEKISENYQAEAPRYSFDQVILAKDVVEKILEAVGRFRLRKKYLTNGVFAQLSRTPPLH